MEACEGKGPLIFKRKLRHAQERVGGDQGRSRCREKKEG